MSWTQAMVVAGEAELDARGLVPLEVARARVAAATRFERGAPRPGGSFDADALWAALISLEDGAAFCAACERLAWSWNPRGDRRLDPVLRFGDGVLPFLRGRVREGVLVDLPDFVMPCLEVLGGEGAAETVWSVKTVASSSFDGAGFTVPPREAPTTADPSAQGLALRWLWNEPGPRFAWLAGRAAGGDARARELLRTQAFMAPSELFGLVAEELGEEAATHAFEAAGAPRVLDATCVLAVLDGAYFAPGAWPSTAASDPAVLAVRRVAVRAPGDGWCVIWQRIEIEDDAVVVRPFVTGSHAGPGWLADQTTVPWVAIDEGDEDDEEVVVDGVSGPLRLPRADLPTDESDRQREALRRYVVARPHEPLWGPPEALLPLTNLADARVLEVTTDFAHLEPGSGSRPSEHTADRALASAIAQG